MAMTAALAGAAASGAVAGRVTAPSTPIPAVVTHVQTGVIPSTRPLSDSTFRIGDSPAAPRIDTPAGVHARQVAP
jgi:hypothetical protein